MATQVQIGQAGEHAVAHALVAKGFHTNVNTKAPGSTDVEGRGSKNNVLVQVKAAISPNAPAGLSIDEERNIKSRATNLGYEAWEARVKLNPQLAAVEIQWRKLN